ncbi:MAG: hypothetical protein J7M40_04365, partial [Planctomycetes bacterium]|nr:hypothetical protein [Planctomycetota bacterium]
TAHHFWECWPDGRDPRNLHGNYPRPWSAMPAGTQPAEYGKKTLVYGRKLRPDAELSFRPVPDSPKYTASAVGHHEGFSGSLILLDPRIVDDGKMSQLKRITPEYFFPEVTSGAIPFNYIQLVKAPVFDKKCVPCHAKHPKAPDMSYDSLARNDRAFSYPGENPALDVLGVGGSRTTPGRFGARASGLLKALTDGPQHKDVKLTDDELRRITLWLDLNSNEIGWIGNDRAEIKAQKEGAALWPPVDIDPSNPIGVENDINAPGQALKQLHTANSASHYRPRRYPDRSGEKNGVPFLYYPTIAVLYCCLLLKGMHFGRQYPLFH